MKMNAIEPIRKGEFPSPGALLDSLEEVFPLIGQMESTVQDPEWHGEGNVRIHTEMVLSEMYQLLANAQVDVSPEHRLALVVGAALHDIGKVLTTRNEDIDGRLRTISPYHPERGCSYVAPHIGELGISAPEIQSLLGLIRHHHDLRKLVVNQSGRHLYARLARCVDLRLMYWLEQCDLRGRICRDLDDELATLELFRLEAEQFELWGTADPYADWKTFLSGEISDSSELSYVTNWAIRDYESGRINSAEEALAKTWEHRGMHGSVTLISAPSGCGKSTWLRDRLDGNVTMISLDDIREELTGKRDDQSKNGRVLQLAKSRLRQALRDKRNIVWDSTALRRDGRGSIIGLAHDYHAASRVVALGVPPRTAQKQNLQRRSQIPRSILEKQYRQWQWPDLWEAHRVDLIFS